MEDQAPRQDGKTTRAMRAAPRGAIYVSAHYISAATYDRGLANALGRNDLVVLSADNLRRAERWGRAVVVDHACKLTEEQAAAVDQMSRNTLKPHEIATRGLGGPDGWQEKPKSKRSSKR